MMYDIPQFGYGLFDDQPLSSLRGYRCAGLDPMDFADPDDDDGLYGPFPSAKEILGHPGYMVTTNGEVFRVGEYTTLATCSTSQKQYPAVRLKSARNRICVHSLVLYAFRGPKPAGQEARHLDDIASHCTLSNLQWGTHAENGKDKQANHWHRPSALFALAKQYLDDGATEIEVRRWLGYKCRSNPSKGKLRKLCQEGWLEQQRRNSEKVE